MFLNQLTLFTLASLATSSGSVLLVDAASGPYFDIQSAVDASSAGDVVLVRSGNYPAFAVVARSLAVAADTGANVYVQGAIRARNVGVGQTLVVSGLRAQDTLSVTTETNGFRATDCPGSIRVQDCELFGGNGALCVPPPPEGMPAGARIRSSSDVLIGRSLLVGGMLPGGYYDPPTPRSGSGVDVESSRVALHQVVARGPDGSTGCPDGSSGGNGATLLPGSEFHAQFCQFEGGRGGSSQPAPAGFGGNGGSGLLLDWACPNPSLARTLSCSFVPGLGGFGSCSIFCGGENFDGAPGSATYFGPCGTIVPLTGVAPTIEFPAVARESTTVTVGLTGAALDRVWLRISRATGHEWVPSQNGVRFVGNGFAAWLLVAELDLTGQASYNLPIQALSVGEQSRIYHLQVLAQRPNGTLQLGSARSLIVVDSAI